MSTTSTGPDRRPRLGLRVRLSLALGLVAGILCVALSFAIGGRVRDAARVEANRYLARMAAEYQESLQRDGKLAAAASGSRRAARSSLAPGLDLAWARKQRSALEASADPALPVELMLVGRDGTVLVGPKDLEGSKLPVPVDGQAAIPPWTDGQHYLAAASVAPGSQGSSTPSWWTLARTRADFAFATAAASQRDILWASLFLVLIGMATGWVLRTRHNHEAERLAHALKAMLVRFRMQAGSLQEAQEHLERRVHERTAELVKLQAELELEVAEARLARDDLARANEQLALALASSQCERALQRASL